MVLVSSASSSADFLTLPVRADLSHAASYAGAVKCFGIHWGESFLTDFTVFGLARLMLVVFLVENSKLVSSVNATE